MMANSSLRSARYGLRTTPEQDVVLRRAAKLANKSLTDFILDSAYQVAEQTLLDQRLFLLDGDQAQSFVELLDRPAQDNPGLQDLLERPAPWSN